MEDYFALLHVRQPAVCWYRTDVDDTKSSESVCGDWRRMLGANPPLISLCLKISFIVSDSSYTHTPYTCTCTCCYDAIKGTQDPKIYSHTHSLNLSQSVAPVCLLCVCINVCVSLAFWHTLCLSDSLCVICSLSVSGALCVFVSVGVALSL